MYLGFYTSHANKKNQLTFPGKFKDSTGKQLLITTWFERSLLILPLETGDSIIKTILKETSSLLPEVRDLERFLYGNATQIRLDSKNRFVVPSALREYAQIGKKAVFVGIGERIELWDEETYLNYGKIRELQIRETAINHYNRITQKT